MTEQLDKMRIEQTHFQKIKAGVHASQAFFVFITGCLSLGVLTKSGGTSGTTGFMFGLCFLTIPALIYQIMVPAWTRAWRFANVYAYASFDILFTILWFGAFVAVAAWNTAGMKGDKNNAGLGKKGTCSAFLYGSEVKCEVSRASVGFGVVLCLLFGVTSALSMQAVFKYRRTGIMPDGSSKRHGRVEQLGVEDPTKGAWSTNIDEHDDEEAHPSNPFGDQNNASMHTLGAYGQVSQEDDVSHGLMNAGRQDHSNTAHDEIGDDPHPGRQLSYGSAQMPEGPQSYDEASAPSAFSPGGYDSGRVSFPQGRYDAGYS